MRLGKAILVFSLGALLVLGFSSVSAQGTLSERQLKESIDGAKFKIKQLKDEIMGYRRKAYEVGESKRTLQGELSKIEGEYTKLVSEVSLTEAELELASLEVSDITKDIIHLENTIDKGTEAVKKSIRKINEVDDQSFLENMLGKISFSDWWRETDDQRMFQSKLGLHIDELQEVKVTLHEKRLQSSAKKDDLYALRKEISDRKRLAEDKKAEKNELLAITRKEEKKFQELIKTKEEAVRDFEEELFEYESQLTFIKDPQALPKKGSAVLSWPLDDVYVTQRFGRTVDSARLYLSGSHSGTDFRANGDPVYAMADGVVKGVGDTDTACRAASFGKWILIAYDNNLASTYGHLSLINVVVGQKVKRGQLVGYSGNTGHTTGPHLHVSLYAGVDAYGNSPVEVKGKPSRACVGKELVQPRAPTEAYLDLLDYTPKLPVSSFKNAQLVD